MAIFEFIFLLFIFFCAVLLGIAGVIALVLLILAASALLGGSLSSNSSARRKKQSKAILNFSEATGTKYKFGRYFVRPKADDGLPTEMTLPRDIDLRGGTTGGDHPQSYTAVRWHLPLPCPNLELRSEQGFHLRNQIRIGSPEFDQLFRVYGKKEPCIHLLESELQEPLLQIYQPATAHSLFSVQIKNKGRVRGGEEKNDVATVTLKIPGRIMQKNGLFSNYPGNSRAALALIERVRNLHAALDARLWKPWHQAATDHSLTLDKENAALSGTIDGQPVHLTLGDNQTHAYVIHIPVKGLKGLHIIHEDKAPENGENIAINNPLVSRMLFITGEDEAKISALFDDQEWIDNLLPLIHAFKGSEVTEDGITVRINKRLVEFSPLIKHAVFVAKRLAMKRSRLPKEEIGEGEFTARPEGATVKE